VPPVHRTVAPAAWRDPRQRLGLRGEEAAMALLRSSGWAIEAHRFRAGRQEIDLVARRGRLVAFVEVKTRRSLACGAPAEAVGWRKRARIARVAEVWRLRHGRAGDEYRFDVVAVGPDGRGELRADHLPDAWRL